MYNSVGKSTIIALLERWYDLNTGSIQLDDVEVKDWELCHLRSQLSLVGQEPVLFNESIRDAIEYGSLEGKLTDSQIEEYARMANIHEFVVGLPDGYQTMVGEKGGQLSGGQKQVYAGASYLCAENCHCACSCSRTQSAASGRGHQVSLASLSVGNYSALDSESEKIVQSALDNAVTGRTTVVIAHRLSTIQNADRIYVVGDGKIRESGTHSELLAKKGVYAELCGQQDLTS